MTDYPRCKTCRHYEPHTPANGDCTRPSSKAQWVQVGTAGPLCDNPRMAVKGDTSFAILPYGCGPDYGCVHHQVKPPRPVLPGFNYEEWQVYQHNIRLEPWKKRAIAMSWELPTDDNPHHGRVHAVAEGDTQCRCDKCQPCEPKEES